MISKSKGYASHVRYHVYKHWRYYIHLIFKKLKRNSGGYYNDGKKEARVSTALSPRKCSWVVSPTCVQSYNLYIENVILGTSLRYICSEEIDFRIFSQMDSFKYASIPLHRWKFADFLCQSATNKT